MAGSVTKRGAASRSPMRVSWGERLFGDRRRLNNRDEGAAAQSLVEFDRAIDQREQRVIAPHADLAAGMKLGAALADDDVAGDDDLAAEFFDAEPAAAAVAPVAGRAACFLMRHLALSWRGGARHRRLPPRR